MTFYYAMQAAGGGKRGAPSARMDYRNLKKLKDSK